MKTEDLTVVETRGSLIERAEQLGEAIRENYRIIAAFFEKHRPLLETGQGRTVLANVRRRYLDECSDMLPYMNAFSRGLDVDLESVIAANVMVALCKSRLEECSGFIIARDGRVVAAQNLDTGESSARASVLEIGRDPAGPDTARFIPIPLTLDCGAGINPYGLAKGGCGGPMGDPIGDGDGLTCTLWRGLLFYRCRTVADVKRLVEKIPVPGKGFNHVYVDSGGRMLWTQQGGGRYAMEEPQTPYCAAAAYRPGNNETMPPDEGPHSHRQRRFMDLGAEAMKKSGDLVEDVKAIVSDHHVVEGLPASAPCRHDGPENSTQFSIITDVTNRVVHYCGQPCENEWKCISL